MKSNGKNHEELFRGLCKVLAENSQALSDGQTKAVGGFIDVLVESLNKKWAKNLKEFLAEQKISIENSEKVKLENRDRAWRQSVEKLVNEMKTNIALKQKKEQASEKVKADSQNKDIGTVLEALNEMKKELNEKKDQAVADAKKELEDFKAKSIEATAKTLALERANSEAIKKELDSKKEELQKANNEIALLKESLRREQIKVYLEKKISGLPQFEADLMRKRFVNATSTKEIDESFQTVLTSVQERTSAAGRLSRNRPLEVQKAPQEQFNESATTSKRVNLLTEGHPMPKPPVEDDLTFIDGDEPIPQADMARWMDILANGND